MPQEKVILTISLLISNKPDMLDKCLTSLRPILDTVKSELIAVDTTGKPEVLAVAEKHGARIVRFEWIDDFAKARNAGMEAARGEWFMFIDDDEWFEDATEIAEFFNSGEYRAYQSAGYHRHNYTRLYGDKYSEEYAVRMVRMVKGMRFISPIHERFIYDLEPEKHFEAYTHHYGYVATDGRTARAKTVRNIRLLERILAEDPEDASALLQLAQEYISDERPAQAEEICERAFSAFDKQGMDNQIYIEYMIKLYAESLIGGGAGAVRAMNEIDGKLEKYKARELIRAVVASWLIPFLADSGKDGDIIRYADIYRACMKSLEENPAMLDSQTRGGLTYALANKRINRVYCYAAASAEKSGDTERAAGYLKSMVGGFGEGDIKILEDNGRGIEKAVAQLEMDDPYVLYCRMKARGPAAEEFSSCAEKTPVNHIVFNRLLKMGAENGYKLGAMLEKMPFDGIDGLCSYALELERWPEDAINAFKAELEAEAAGKLKYQGFKAVFDTYYFSCAMPEDDSELLNSLKALCAGAMEYYSRVYAGETLTDEGILNASGLCRYFYYTDRALDAERNGRVADCLKYLRLSALAHDGLVKIIRRVMEIVNDRIEATNKANAAKSEMELLAQKVKQDVRKMIEAGNRKTAASVLTQLETLMPDDEEIAELKKRAWQ